MRTVRTVAALRAELARLRARGQRIALVPTMGAFHAGHLDLMRRAAQDGHAVVVSLFVNPTQFAPGEDLSTYPRDERRDARLAEEAAVSVLFVPDADELYPEGFATTVTVAGPAQGFEGATRPTHFAGVATVVAKLLIAARPDRAVFGQKDAQQVAVIRRMMRDLHLDDVELIVAPIVREPDGLAMSSRNVYLSPTERTAALALSRGLNAAARLAADGERDTARLEGAVSATIAAEPACQLDYVAAVDRDRFHPVPELAGPTVLAVAARVGTTRLIDNVLLPTPPTE